MTDTTALLPSHPAAGLLGQLIEMGGPAMVVLVAMAVTGLITFIYLMLSGTLYAPRFTSRIKRSLRQWQQHPSTDCPAQLRQTGRLGRLNPLLHLVADTMHAKLNHKDPQQIRETVARDAGKALEPFEAPLKIIEVIAALAPLLGLLGTVMGMMEAFNAMAAAEGRANASQLSGGIYEALSTTAAGLVVAIPFAALAAWIEFRLRRIHKTINATLVSVLAVTVPETAGKAMDRKARKPSADVREAEHHATHRKGEDQYSGLSHATG